jgi:hypothetical protein
MDRLLRAASLSERKQDPNRPWPFGPWLPDLPAYENQGCMVAKNCIPRGPAGYRPLGSLAAYSNVLDARCQGAARVIGTDLFPYAYAGTATKLQVLQNGSWVDRSGATYNCPTDEYWEFLQFGTAILACNLRDPVQGMTIGGAGFADWFTSTLKPKARHMARVNRFLMLGNMAEASAEYPNRVRWSGIGDSLDMDADPATQADYQDLEGGGPVQRITSGEDGYVFQSEMIRRAVYEGSPTVFRIEVVEENRGTVAPYSVVRIGRIHLYLANDGFYLFDGIESHPIGDRRVNQFFFDSVNSSYVGRCVASIDYRNQLYCFAYPTTSSSDGTPNRILFYHWPSGWWSYADVSVEWLFNDVSDGLSLDDLDSISASLDALTPSLDSPFWSGNQQRRLGAFSTSHALGTFTGASLEATWETAVKQLYPGKLAMVSKAIPLSDGGTPTIAVAGNKRLQDAFTYGAAGTLSQSGLCPVRARGRFHKFKMIQPAGETWTHVQGIQPVAAVLGDL